MNSNKSENGPDSSNGRALKLQVAAAIALEKIDQLCSAGPVEQERLDVEVARIAQKNVQPAEYDLVGQRRRDDLAHRLIKIRRGEAGYDVIKRFLDVNKGLPPETKV
jgi:hypothetical protein